MIDKKTKGGLDVKVVVVLIVIFMLFVIVINLGIEREMSKPQTSPGKDVPSEPLSMAVTPHPENAAPSANRIEPIEPSQPPSSAQTTQGESPREIKPEEKEYIKDFIYGVPLDG